ncbi:glutamate racemase [Ferrimonas balearica]|uniref:glutamate racemase n=1 Tax=Ferrimonas balearica TaxID=44012 RepID=UPI001C9978F9|nr:glutamate racemase [Ferrimonas balearica]MBY5993992.1 glutamate racemase [Ferrimonas balearica]
MGAILIFDSGLGGLTIHEHIRQALPDRPVRYLADNARFPYGELAPTELIDGCVALIRQQVEAHPIDLVVIACNSASTLVLEALRAAIPCPVVGVVPAIKPAAALSYQKVIGLLATPGTVQRPYTDQLAADFAADCQLLRLGSSELVRLAEAKLNGQSVATGEVARILTPFTQGDLRPDVVVLGCTHFPLLKEEIAQALGPQVRLVDSGAAIARRVSQLLATDKPLTGDKPQGVFIHTGTAPGAALNAYLAKQGLSTHEKALF